MAEATAEYARPELRPEYDEQGEPTPGTLNAGWDVSFGCRMNFGPNPDGDLRVSVHVSDHAKRDGIAVTPTTPASLRVLAAHLLAVADAADAKAPPVRLARCSNYREDLDTPCDGVLVFRTPPDPDAACGTCGGRCGWMVADYLDPIYPPAETGASS